MWWKDSPRPRFSATQRPISNKKHSLKEPTCWREDEGGQRLRPTNLNPNIQTDALLLLHPPDSTRSTFSKRIHSSFEWIHFSLEMAFINRFKNLFLNQEEFKKQTKQLETLIPFNLVQSQRTRKHFCPIVYNCVSTRFFTLCVCVSALDFSPVWTTSLNKAQLKQPLIWWRYKKRFAVLFCCY